MPNRYFRTPQSFPTMLNAVASHVRVRCGFDPEITLMDDRSGSIRVANEAEHTLTLSWQAPNDDEHTWWTVTQSSPDDSTADDVVEGEHPRRSPLFEMISRSNALIDKAPQATVAPRGRFVTRVFGWTMAFAVFVLARLISVSVPPEQEDASLETTFTEALATAQQLLNHVSLSDVPSLIGASLVNSPLISLLLLTALMFLLCLSTLPSIMYGHDLASWRTVAMLAVLLAAAAGSVLLTPWPWRILTVAALILYAWALLSLWRRGTHIEKWLRYSRDIRWRVDEMGRALDWTTTVADDRGEAVTMRELTRDIDEKAIAVKKRIWSNRDTAFGDPSVIESYMITRWMTLALAAEVRAHRRGRTTTAWKLAFRRWVDEAVLTVRQFLLSAGLPVATVLLVALAAFSPTPWIAPSCATGGEISGTVYVLSEDRPVFLLDATRAVTMVSSWGDVELSAGACATAG